MSKPTKHVVKIGLNTCFLHLKPSQVQQSGQESVWFHLINQKSDFTLNSIVSRASDHLLWSPGDTSLVSFPDKRSRSLDSDEGKSSKKDEKWVVFSSVVRKMSV